MSSHTIPAFAEASHPNASASGFAADSSPSGARCESDAVLEARNRLARLEEHARYEVHYQAQMELKTRRIVGAEALLRMRDAEGALISPAQFIPDAEACGAILGLGQYVLAAAARDHAWFSGAGYTGSVSVNLSPAQFVDPDLAARCRATVLEHSADPHSIELEITENLEWESARYRPVLDDLRRTGFAIVIDDFGSGYAALSRLQEAPVDKIKLDRSFVRHIVSRPRHAGVARALIEMARSLETPVVAEGIETPDQLELLRGWGCDQVQGFLLSRPLPAASFLRFVGIVNAGS